MRHFALFACLALWLAPAARAEAQNFPHDDFSAHRFYVAPGPGNFLTVEGLELAPDWTPSFGATLGYANGPFIADDLDCLTGRRIGGCGDPASQDTGLLAHLGELQLYGAITLFERIQLGLNLPFLQYDGERYDYMGVDANGLPSPRLAAPGGSGAAVGDPRLSAKIRLIDPDREGNGVMMGVSGWVSAPLGHAIAPGRFVGDMSPSFGAHFIGAFRLQDFRLAFNLGAHVRAEATNLRSEVGTELSYGLGVGYRFHRSFETLVEVAGATSFGVRFDSEAPLEVRAAALIHLGAFTMHVGAGAGVVYGVGVPVARVFLGGSFSPLHDRDADGDGVPDSRDACPTEAEDLDGFQDEDGCPELDNDEDGLSDAEDPCPDEAEDVDGFQDEDGCPEPDNDGDGIPDGYDSCPDQPEDVDGDRDHDGCPDLDRDGDGILDDVDRCPSEAEDFDGLSDEDGCPEADADEDGVPDEDDECPEEPGAPAHRGCPPPPERGR